MKILHGLIGLTLALGIGTGYAQDQTQDDKKELPEAAADGQQTAETARAGKFKAGKALADTVKATAGPPDFIDDDDDGDGIGDATERKRPGRVKYADVTFERGKVESDDSDTVEADDKKKPTKKKGDNH
ncbi:hypothetical protein [Pseudidiomarina salilacus]|uniref:hypothetical protein n=1 Tax=Pseudidiomarina salilacus TaxID=3384452 RepID=UPI003984BAF6